MGTSALGQPSVRTSLQGKGWLDGRAAILGCSDAGHSSGIT